MNHQEYTKYKVIIIIAVVVIALLEIPGAIDLWKKSYYGFEQGNDFDIVRIIPDSPAEHAGLMVGDRFLKFDETDVNDTKTLMREPRWKIGEQHTYTIERDGETLTLDIVPSGLPLKEIAISLVGAVIGLCFLFFGLWAYLKVQTKNTLLFTLVGICFGFGFISPLYIKSFSFALIYSMLETVIIVYGFAILLHFMLSFPEDKKILQKKIMLKLVYSPATLIVLAIFSFLIIQPESSSMLRILFNIFIGFFIFSYVILSIIAMIHSYVKAKPEERKKYGLNMMLVGTVIAFGTLAVARFFYMIVPTYILFGSDYYPLVAILIPITYSRAAVKKEMS